MERPIFNVEVTSRGARARGMASPIRSRYKVTSARTAREAEELIWQKLKELGFSPETVKATIVPTEKTRRPSGTAPVFFNSLKPSKKKPVALRPKRRGFFGFK